MTGLTGGSIGKQIRNRHRRFKRVGRTIRDAKRRSDREAKQNLRKVGRGAKKVAKNKFAQAALLTAATAAPKLLA